MFPVGTAQAQSTTYDIQAGADFFDAGVPGFSGRFYPGSVTVHRGDTLRFDFPFFGMAPPDSYPQDLFGEEQQVGHPDNFLMWDEDDGDLALKANLDVFFNEGTDCGTADNPCVWGDNTEPFFPAFRDEPPFEVYVVIDAAPGTTLWAASLVSPEANVNLKVEVVPDGQQTSTQEELNLRASQLRAKDFEDISALHSKMSAKSTWHRNASGQKVYDVFVGASAGPNELFASYPKRSAIPAGSRVQFHFMSQMEPHTATFGGATAKEVFFNSLMPVCDPDGDGTSPDVQPDFENPDPETGMPACPEGTELEMDVHDLLPFAVGDGKVTKQSDYQNSGLIGPYFPDGNVFQDHNPDPMTVRFPKESGKKGYRFICALHGGFMGGKIVTK